MEARAINIYNFHLVHLHPMYRPVCMLYDYDIRDGRNKGFAAKNLFIGLKSVLDFILTY